MSARHTPRGPPDIYIAVGTIVTRDKEHMDQDPNLDIEKAFSIDFPVDHVEDACREDTKPDYRRTTVTAIDTDNKDILALFGYDQNSKPTADDLIYYTYLRIGVEGLCALSSFKVEDQAWGGDHDQALFAIFKHILQDGDGVMWVEHDPVAKELFVRVDRSKIVSHGKLSIGRMLCKIHIWRSTADVNACRPFYEALSAVDDEYEIWRQIVVSKPQPRWKFVQPNTFLKDDGTVELRDYEVNNVGIIESFFERKI
ncbi:dipeptidyl peptidase III [Aspergillus terreus]|uniref:Dipeptidyl peptidase III n=1 Tax=Aspergillus terreus TaxID=33178 RepID=A0A5M3Z7P7_ASPTE|nr:hypothetical protein ATETN484_0011016800 [Aspergillus terreus]GFF18805.1 dipeptidyl peptidase III [Aspergillus terreus]